MAKDLEFFEIDSNKLDEEWIAQPGHYHDQAIHLADAKREAAEAEAALKLVEAELLLDIKRDPTKYALDKPPVDIIKAAVLVQPEYRKALARLIQADHEVDVHRAGVSSLDHKKKGLEDLVQLRLADYFSEPKARGPVREKMDEEKKRRVRSSGRERREEE